MTSNVRSLGLSGYPFEAEVLAYRCGRKSLLLLREFVGRSFRGEPVTRPISRAFPRTPAWEERDERAH